MARTPLRRRRPIAELPPPPPEPPPATLPTTRLQRQQRRDQVEFMLIRGDGFTKVAEMCRERFSIGAKGTRKLVDEVHTMWADEGEKDRVIRKERQLRRLYQELQMCKVARNADGTIDPGHFKWTAITQLEKLIAEIEGNLAPIKVEATATLNHALIAVIHGLTDEQKVEMIARQRAMRLAAASAGYVPENDVQALPRTGPR